MQTTNSSPKVPLNKRITLITTENIVTSVRQTVIETGVTLSYNFTADVIFCTCYNQHRTLEFMVMTLETFSKELKHCVTFAW